MGVLVQNFFSRERLRRGDDEINYLRKGLIASIIWSGL
jgi:hypothetical protein